MKDFINGLIDATLLLFVWFILQVISMGVS